MSLGAATERHSSKNARAINGPADASQYGRNGFHATVRTVHPELPPAEVAAPGVLWPHPTYPSKTVGMAITQHTAKHPTSIAPYQPLPPGLLGVANVHAPIDVPERRPVRSAHAHIEAAQLRIDRLRPRNGTRERRVREGNGYRANVSATPDARVG